MKKLSVLILITVLFFSSNTFAQNFKFGHIDASQLIQAMPDREKAKTELQTYAKQLEDQLGEMQREMQAKQQDYVEQKDTISDLIRQTKEEELQSLYQRVQTFQQTAQQDLQKKESDLMQPIIEKARTAIKDVATENKFTYIFDTSAGVLLYWSPDSQDVMPLVKKKLAIQ
ncbi:MAG: OmpH family outer membrane protein [Bacteroidetes bacterium]|nr:OmpH family outer membrane protein [Bacteroidota bacterium]